jgi:hypothetical protein
MRTFAASYSKTGRPGSNMDGSMVPSGKVRALIAPESIAPLVGDAHGLALRIIISHQDDGSRGMYTLQ